VTTIRRQGTDPLTPLLHGFALGAVLEVLHDVLHKGEGYSNKLIKGGGSVKGYTKKRSGGFIMARKKIAPGMFHVKQKKGGPEGPPSPTEVRS